MTLPKNISKNKFVKIFTLILVIITVGNFFYRVFLYRSDIFKKFDYKYWTYRYTHSQWSTSKCLVTDPHINPYTCKWDDSWYAKHPTILPEYQKISIGDDGLYMYAGAAYIKGQDPTLLNAELPPFGKYLVGIFEIVTGYNGFFSVFFSGLVLILLYLFNKKVFSSSFLAILPVTLFSFDPLFTEQIRAPFLDTLYLSLLLLGFFLLLNKKYLFTGIALGLFMATKSPFLIVVVYSAIIIWLFMQKFLSSGQKPFSFKNLLLMIIPTIIVYISTYFATFLQGHSLLYLLKVQKYIIHFYSSGAKAVIGAVFPMLFEGNWYTWFSGVQKVAEWSIGWPIVTIGFLAAVGIWFKNKDPKVLFLLLWSGFYLAFLVITPIYARYLLLLLPFLYNLSIWSLSAVIKSRFS